MKITYNWIREFVELALTPSDAADRLTNAGVEVASVTPLAPDLRGVVVGEIEAIERELGESHGHRLLLCRVSTGRERFSVVCGAPNTTVGVRAAFAPPGATLPGAHTIGVAKIRGVESQGTLCSERELGLGEEHEAGILVLDPDAPLGADLVAHLGLDDHVLEIEITPNRPDCLSVVGVARELAALTGARFTPPALALKESDEPVDSLVRVRIEAPDLCHRFTARVIDGVRVAPSPAGLAQRLRAVGLRPISNVVDITNYVMWEIGHPLHAFDYRAVTDATIVVRRAHPGERITTLDGQDRGLEASMLLIADPKRSIGIAGVMGGANTEVSEATRRVLLESAYFLPASIRRTSRELGLPTDAAYRFERGADIEGLLDGSARAAQMMVDIAGGTLARGVVDAYPTRHERPLVALRMKRVQRLIGAAPPGPEARRILVALGLDVRDRGDDFEVEIPPFRRDLTMEDDLVEEIVRVWGYDKIPSTLEPTTVRLVRQPFAIRQAEVARRALVAAGLYEAITYSFGDPALQSLFVGADTEKTWRLRNPLSNDAAVLRRHPLEGLMPVVASNLRRQQPSVALFEIGKTYERNPSGPDERRWAAIALAGLRSEATWYDPPRKADVYDASGLAQHVVAALGVRTEPKSGSSRAWLEIDNYGELVTPSSARPQGGEVVAQFGEVHASVVRAYGIDIPVFAALVSLDAVAKLTVPTPQYQPLPRYPGVQRDLAFVINDAHLTAAEIEGALREAAGPLLRDLGIFDVFQLPDGRRSVAWRLTFQADDRTLTDEEVNAIREAIVRRVTERLNITVRG